MVYARVFSIEGAAANERQARIHTRSELILSDLDSKCGTVIDGEQVKGASNVQGTEHSVQLGRYPHALRCVCL